MLIHDFHSKLMSGKDEGGLFKALRRLSGLGGPVFAAGEEPSNWCMWMDETGASTEPGWAYWQEGSESVTSAEG